MDKLTIIKKELYCIEPVEPVWIGVGAYVEDGFPKEAVREPKILDVDLPSGWRVYGVFFTDNMGQGFGNFYARKNNYVVFGDYENGVYSENEEALKDFSECHPPYQED